VLALSLQVAERMTPAPAILPLYSVTRGMSVLENVPLLTGCPLILHYANQQLIEDTRPNHIHSPAARYASHHENDETNQKITAHETVPRKHQIHHLYMQY